MSDDKDKNDLLDLFSTRRGSGGPSSRTSLALPEKQGDGVPSNRKTATTRNSNLDGGSNRTSANPTVPVGGSRGTVSEMSSIAGTVLKETRRELGSDYNLQQAQKTGQSIEERDILAAVERVLARQSQSISDIEKANIVIHLQKDLMGWGVLQPLIDNPEVTDIHVYDYQTVVLQRGKKSETTGLYWPNKGAYKAFLDRLLLRLGKSLTTQNHTVDAALQNGIRICAVHESVCGQRGPLLCLRVPRLMDIKLENLVTYQVAPPLVVNYLACLTRSGSCTMMIAGETGTGKTTVIKCLGTQFGPDESVIAVEDTPELNFDHPYFRSLVSRPANTEGQGEVTLQEHIKTTLRMTPTRVILGEMRTPPSAEAFLESAQTGHVGMSTIHARNARETLVRLEGLLGRAQKSVSVEIIRQQIALAIDCVVWLFREKQNGRPRIGEIVEVGHYVEGTIQLRPMFKLIQGGDKPQWRLESWTSSFDQALQEHGIFLGDCPKEFGFGPSSGPNNTRERSR
jgi:pilus assembly protein CpaF